MKKHILLVIALFMCISASAQRPVKSELKQLQAFLSQPAMESSTNAAALKITDLNNPASWDGVKMEGGRIVEIDWSGKRLAGDLDLSGFKNLSKVNLSNNRITSVLVNDNPALNYLNVGRNRLTSINVSACPQLRDLRVYRNQLSSIDISGTPVLERLNVSGNSLVELNLSNAVLLNIMI